MKITFIIASVGKQINNHYVRSWIMEPLSLATLSALTPPHIERVFYDDRIEDIPFDEPTDLVAINTETYTAARAYQIAYEYQKRNVKVILGGFHATLMPEEAAEYADSVLVGEAEGIWEDVLNDVMEGQIRKFYRQQSPQRSFSVTPDRSIFNGKGYPKLSLVETGRGCCFGCEFCSITHFFSRKYMNRSIKAIVDEIKSLKNKLVFFVDDNIGVHSRHSKELFKALIPLKIKWVSQISMDVAHDEEFLKLMKESGCQGVLIGFESFNADTLKRMGKDVNKTYETYDYVVQQFHKHGLALYATFVMGYHDTEKDFEEIYRFGIRNKILYVAFNHLVPFPGTKLYERFEKEGRLRYQKWWLEPNYRFGDVVYEPDNISAQELTELCLKYRYKYFNWMSILRRLPHKMYLLNPMLFFSYLLLNLTAKHQAKARRNLIIGGNMQEHSIKEVNTKLQLVEV